MTQARIDSRIERLQSLYPKLIDLRLDRLQHLLGELGNPERRLPPVIHVAGTNGKGSVCAFARAIAEEAGLGVHVYTSPHLVRFNERIRLAGAEIDDQPLDDVLAEIEHVNDTAPITVFEAITAAAFLAFSRVPADLALIEVGLGGLYDATNVIRPPRVAAITSVSLDHRDFLGDTEAVIAREKAGIIKQGSRAVTGLQRTDVLDVIRDAADSAAVPLTIRDRDWHIRTSATGLRFDDGAGTLDLPRPALAGPHQFDNAGIAIAALRASGLALPAGAFADGLARAEWPGRMQRLGAPLAERLPAGSELWLDGAHNPGGALAIAETLRLWDGPTHLVIGMKQAKDVGEFLQIVIPHAASIQAVAEPDQHLALPVADIVAASNGVATPGPDIATALGRLAEDGMKKRVLICGSLYLAGVVLGRQRETEPA